MLPTPTPPHMYQMQPSADADGGGAGEGAGAGPALHPTLRASSVRGGGSSGGNAQGGAGGTVIVAESGGIGGGGGGVERPKIKSIKMMDRLRASELLRVSLPFKEVTLTGAKNEDHLNEVLVTLRNGDVVARRGCGIVLHTRAEGRDGNVWLKCRSNQDRGALVDALVPWFEANSAAGRGELNVQQVPEGPLAAELRRSSVANAERVARSGSWSGLGSTDVTRRKDTDCVIS
eukprot:jgi/Undpi1/1422/HiC_scaffold_11.g04813.m1